jgi:very-short-patch-repair endonuclease
LWVKLKRKQLKGYQFYRQKIIENYIVDFYCPKANLIIEIDGGQHYSKIGTQKDIVRDKQLAQIGLQVLRFSDLEIFKNLDGELETIWKYL